MKIYQTLVGLRLVFREEKHGIQTQGTEVLLPSAWSVGADLSRTQGLPSCSGVLLRTWGGGLAPLAGRGMLS